MAHTSAPPPSLASELRRGVNAYNLTVGLVTSVVISGAAFGLMRLDVFNPPFGWDDWKGAGALGMAAFVAVTGLHTAAHAYFGWRFERGLRAHAAGDRDRAVRLLRVAAWRGMDHYDPHGIARAALKNASE